MNEQSKKRLSAAVRELEYALNECAEMVDLRVDMVDVTKIEDVGSRYHYELSLDVETRERIYP